LQEKKKKRKKKKSKRPLSRVAPEYMGEVGMGFSQTQPGGYFAGETLSGQNARARPAVSTQKPCGTGGRREVWLT
jgi:hypothetical protein